jgi:predicted enzyme related to lactoylglutathione lyase
MTDGLKTIIYPVRDLAAATALYRELLGVPPTTEQPYYVGFDVAGQQVGLDPNGHRNGQVGPVGYWHVPDIRTAVQALVAAGAQVQRDVRDVGGGRLIATLTDADGNLLGLLQPQ